MATYNPLISERIAKQDATIDLIEKGLNEYSAKAVKIKQELEEQNNKVDILAKGVDDADNRVNVVTNKTKTELKFATMWGNCGLIPVIVFFAVVIIIAIILLIY